MHLLREVENFLRVRLTRDLAEAEFSLAGHIVADIAVEGAMIEHPDGAISLTIEALTVAE